MPIIKSAKKRVKITKRATARNAYTKKELRAAIKNFEQAVKSGKNLSEAFAKAQSAIDTAVKKNLWTKNKAARKKSALVKLAGGKIKAGPGKPKKTVKATAKKPAAKKTAPKTAKKSAKKK